ncbi:MAG: GbsR/MarR family transcriptional regulator [Candidatus Kariarchaeaceae archaeon]|jgi:DNA-binding transcriptional regulator GbsR (MarR family)
MSSKKATVKVSEKQKDFMQGMGLFMESMGLTPVAGQMVGWLLISDEEHQSATQLKTVLQVAKSTISTTVRQLVQMGFIEKIRMHGDRLDYYRFNHKFLENSRKKRLEGIDPFTSFFKKASDFIDPQSDRVKIYQEMIDMSEFIQEETKKIYSKWDEIRKEKYGT